MDEMVHVAAVGRHWIAVAGHQQLHLFIYLFIYYVIVHKVQKAEQWTFAQSNNHHDVYKKKERKSNQLLIQYI